MLDLQTTSTIRQRGQLTIPDKFRKKLSWAKPGAAVKITADNPDEFVVRRYEKTQKEVDWKKLWKQIKRVRSFKGKGKPISLSEFIAKDRISGHSI